MRSYELAVSPVRGEFNLAHLQQIHQRQFGDVYDWAGKIRTVDISKRTTRFASYEQIASYAPQITRPLSREGLQRMANLIRANLRDMDREYALDLAKAVAGECVHVVLAAPGCDYEGVVIGSTECYLLQEQKGQAGEMVLHSRRALLNVDLAVPRQVIGIRYPHGDVGLVERTEPQAEQAYSMQHQRDRDLGR